MLDRPHNPSLEKATEKIPGFSLDLPEGEDVVRVRWGQSKFALIPQFIKGVSGRDNVFIDVQRTKTHPEEGLEADIFDEITFGFEVPLQTANGADNPVFDGKTPPVAKAKPDHLRMYVDPAMTDADFDKLMTAAKNAYLMSMKKQQNRDSQSASSTEQNRRKAA
jgi:hypothetical protein